MSLIQRFYAQVVSTPIFWAGVCLGFALSVLLASVFVRFTTVTYGHQWAGLSSDEIVSEEYGPQPTVYGEPIDRGPLRYRTYTVRANGDTCYSAWKPWTQRDNRPSD